MREHGNADCCDDPQPGGVKRSMTERAKSLLKRKHTAERGTFMWLDRSYNSKIDYDAMIESVHNYHPRQNKNEMIPLCEPTGQFNFKVKERVLGIDQLGKAVSMYFKLLKAVAIFYGLVIFLSIPLFVLYSSGEM